MTGTALTEAQEFAEIYGLDVIEIPTNVDVNRLDDHDEFYRTAAEKHNAIIEELKVSKELGQPVLVGTVSIEKSEELSDALKKAKIKHKVLNARYHEQEASIISQAGIPGAITIATNMAGRGTDIQLGGNLDMRISEELGDMEEGDKRDKAIAKIEKEIAENKAKVLDAGGLYVIGTERHESRRIDNQLRGRSGRQGDPGRSKFYLSLQDDLMRIFGPERMDGMLVKMGLEEGEAIIHPWINKAIEKAQQKVEARNYDIRKNLLKYDDVMNNQRRAIYDQRREIMVADEVTETITDMRHQTVEDVVMAHVPPKTFPDQWDISGLSVEVKKLFNISPPLEEWAKEEGVEESIVTDRIIDLVDEYTAKKTETYGIELWQRVEKSLLLQTVDQDWKDHLSSLEHLRAVITLRAYGQRDPLNEYKTEAFSMFENLLVKARENVSQLLSHIEISVEQPPQNLTPEAPEMVAKHLDPITGENEMAPVAGSPAAMGGINPEDPNTWGKVPRNSICLCGSGKKFKHCHGRL